MTADELIHRGSAVIRPLLEDYYGPLMDYGIAPVTDAESQSFMQVCVDLDRRRPVLLYAPKWLERWLKKGDFGTFIHILKHEHLHIANYFEDWEHAGINWHLRNWDDATIQRSMQYKQWREASAILAQLAMDLDLLTQDRLHEPMVEIFGPGSLQGKYSRTRNRPEWMLSWVLSSYVTAAYLYGEIKEAHISSLELPFDLPDSVVKLSEAAVAKQMRSAKRGKQWVEFVMTYYVPGVINYSRLLSATGMTASELLHMPMTDGMTKRLLAADGKPFVRSERT